MNKVKIMYGLHTALSGILKITDWTKHSQDRVKWKETVEKAENFEQ